MNETVPCSGPMVSMRREVTDEQLARSPALRPSSNSELKACNTWGYIPSMFLRYILNLVWVHSAHLLDVIRQCDELVSPSVLLLICESRPNSFDFWGSGYSHGEVAWSLQVWSCAFYFQEIQKYMPNQSATGVQMKRYRTWNSCNDTLKSDLICQCVANCCSLFRLHAFKGW